MKTEEDRCAAATSLGVERYLMAGISSTSARSPATATGQRRAAALLALMGSPQNDLRVVHVAGTAGKGSVSTFIASILRAQGFRVGTYLSPHVHSVLERFQIDARPAPEEHVAAALRVVRDGERRLDTTELGHVTMFEAATATAFQLFRDHDVDYAVIETGIGGLHDATNTVSRSDKLAVLTTIGLDHTEVLGPTVADIARQKAGIFPAGGAAIALRGGPRIDKAIRVEGRRRQCTVDHLAPAHAADLLPAGVVLGLPGRHQRVNAGLALRAVRHLADRDGWSLRLGRTTAGLASARLPGRFERRRWHGRPVVLDGAHNEIKLAALACAVRDEWPDRAPIWVLTFKPDKDVDDAMKAIAPSAARVFATQFDSDGTNQGRGHALAASEVAAAAQRAGIDAVETYHSIGDALQAAIELSDPDAPLVVTGSFFAVADAGKVMPK